MPCFQNPFLQTRWQPFLCFAGTVALLVLLGVFGSIKLPVVVYKLVMELLGGAAGCFLYLVLFPFANPARFLAKNWRDEPEADVPGGADFAIAEGYRAVFCICLCCATCFSCAGMLAVCWGL